jgi:hypothetical protein
LLGTVGCRGSSSSGVVFLFGIVDCRGTSFFASLIVKPCSPCNASSKLLEAVLGAEEAFIRLPGHNLRGLGSSSSEPDEFASEPHHTLSSTSASSSRSSSTTTDGLREGRLAKAFNLGIPSFAASLPFPETSFRGLLRELSGDAIFWRSSLKLSDAFNGASLICRFARALSVETLTTSLDKSISLSESSWKISLSTYDLDACLRGDVRSLDVVFVVLVRVDSAWISSPESLPTGLSRRSRAIIITSITKY